jgi:hypothetical protein
LLFGVICFLGGTALVVTSWFVLAWVPALGVRLPGFEPTDPDIIWAFVGLGCVLLIMTFLTLREYGARRYRSTIGILTAGVVALIFIIVVFVASHGQAIHGL